LICHEVWAYDDLQGVQSLTGVEIHCADCDGVTHFGRTSTLGRPDLVEAARARLGEINGWRPEQVHTYVIAVREEWRARSAQQWTQDIVPADTQKSR
jgi:hypothetical protein